MASNLRVMASNFAPCFTQVFFKPRPACGTAFSSVHPILSVFGLAPTRDGPAECLPWTRPLNGGTSLSPLLWRCTCPERTADGLRHKKWDVCLIFGIPSWLMPLRDRSGQPTISARHKVTTAVKASFRFIGTCGELSPLLPLPSPFFPCFLGFS